MSTTPNILDPNGGNWYRDYQLKSVSLQTFDTLRLTVDVIVDRNSKFNPHNNGFEMLGPEFLQQKLGPAICQAFDGEAQAMTGWSLTLADTQALSYLTPDGKWVLRDSPEDSEPKFHTVKVRRINRKTEHVPTRQISHFKGDG